MKLLRASQIKEWDKYTISHEPITPIDLMERASLCFTLWFTQMYGPEEHPIDIYCGNGNNGGDGLAIARLLRDRHYNVQVYIHRFVQEDSDDFDINLGRLLHYGDVPVHFIHDELPVINKNAILIDALMGTGVHKPVAGTLHALIKSINATKAYSVISVDMPSGLPAEGLRIGETITSDITFTFQLPKLSFFHKENSPFVGYWVVGDIGLHPDFLTKVEKEVIWLDRTAIQDMFKKRTTYQHKGDFGHALIVAGSEGKMGAAILASKACLRSGAGLVTAFVPQVGEEVMQETIPEVMVKISGQTCFNTGHLPMLDRYTIGIGPGLGIDAKSISAMEEILAKTNAPVVIDADAINIIASHRHLLDSVPKGSVLTPHLREFERLFGATGNSEEMYRLQQEMSVQYGVYIVLKGANTRITTPLGISMINSTGNPGMATAGAGDVLTGIITGCLAQGYTPEESTALGVYVHGLAGDLALEQQSHESLIASDIIDRLGQAFKTIQSY